MTGSSLLLLDLMKNADLRKKIAEKTVEAINAPLDYVEKSVWVEFSGIPSSGKLRIILDEKSSMEEIYKGNNTAVIQ